GNVAVFAQAHRPPAKFDRLKTLVNQLPADFLGLGRCVAKENGSIGKKCFFETAAKKLIDWPSGGFADDVPQGDLNAAHGLDDSSLTSEVDRPFIHAMNESLDFERILAQNAFRQPAGDLVRQGSFDYSLGDGRRRVHLADAHDAGVCVNLDSERFLA